MILPLNYNFSNKNTSGNFCGRFFGKNFPLKEYLKSNFRSDLRGDKFTKDEGQKQAEDDVSCILSKKEQKKISEALLLKMPDTIGAEADFYTIKGYGIKKMAKSNTDALIRENDALKYLASNGVFNIPKTKGVFLEDFEACLVTDIKAGASISPSFGKILTKENLENLFKIFFEMDKALFSHSDLHFGNVLIDGNRVNLIDFGDYSIVDDMGENLDATRVKFGENVTLNPKKRLQKLISKAARGEKNMGLDFSDNPNLPFNFSVSNFEYRFLSPYLKDLEDISKKDAGKFFKGYLKAKGEYYKRRAEYYNGLVNSFGNNLGKNYLRQAVLYDMAAANVLSEPTGKVLEIERLKADFKAGLFEKQCKDEDLGDSRGDLRGSVESGPGEANYRALDETYRALIRALDEVLDESRDNDLILYAEALKKVYTNPYWMWMIEN